MASAVELIVTIDPKNPGNPSIEGKGFKDASCLKEAEGIVNALGAKVTKQTKKIESATPAKQQVTLGKKP